MKFLTMLERKDLVMKKRILTLTLLSLALASCDANFFSTLSGGQENNQNTTISGDENNNSKPNEGSEDQNTNQEQGNEGQEIGGDNQCSETGGEEEHQDDPKPEKFIYELAQSNNDIAVGDAVVIASTSSNYIAGSVKSSNGTYFLEALSGTIEDGVISELPEGAHEYVIGGTSNGYTLKADNGTYLGATASKKISLSENSNNWKISISSGSAAVSHSTSTYGSIKFNKTNPRFTVYSSSNTSLELPGIYVKKSTTPIYAESISINGPDSMYIGATTGFNVSYSPVTTNMKGVIWESVVTSVATIDKYGFVTANKVGTTTIIAKAMDKNGEYTLRAEHTLAVNPVPVTSVSLDSTTKKLKLGDTAQLIATVAPSSATNKNVSWTSSNTSVASVSKTGLVTALAYGETTITVTTEDGSKKATCVVTVAEKVLDPYTILIYMCGSDLEGGSDYYGTYYMASDDITEMLSVSGQPEGVNIAIQTGGSKGWSKKYNIPKDKSARYHIRNKQLIQDSQFTRQNMSDESTFQQFLEWGIEAYPAEKTAVILWNHGGGMEGCCYDQYTNDYLTPEQLTNATRKAFQSLNRTEKLEWIGYDCCLMQVQDIAEKNSQYFKYQVAAQESEAGEGWDYDGWLPTLYNNTSVDMKTLGKKIGDTFVQDFSNSYPRETNLETLSTLDLTKIAAYKTAWEAMANDLSTNYIKSTSNWSTLATTIKKCEKYAIESTSASYSPCELYDTDDFLNKIISSSSYSKASANAQAALDALDDVILTYSNGSGHKNSSGLSFFAPVASQYSKSVYDENSTNFTKWRTMCVNYGSWSSGGGWWY